MVGDDDTPVEGDDDTVMSGDDDTVESTPSPTPATDSDGDGFSAALDCDDSNPAINPGQEELCDGLDNNCDGATDEGVMTDYYPDLDGDGFGDEVGGEASSDEVPGMIELGGDCDDTDAAVHPIVVEAGAGEGDGSWESPVASIQGAINGNNPCAWVVLKAGEYSEPVLIEGWAGFTLIGLDGPEQTLLKGQGGTRALEVSFSSEVLIEGIGAQAMDPVAGIGAAILAHDSSDIAFTDVWATNSVSEGDGNYGGGIGIESTSGVVLTDVVLRGNEAERGGGLSVGSSKVTMIRGTVEQNLARDGGGGAYVANTSGLSLGSLTVWDSSFVENNAGYGGGIWNTEAQTLEVYSTLFQKNRVEYNGGGASSVTLCHQCRFIKNEAYGDFGNGGGLYLRSSALIENSIFIENAANWGGAIGITEFDDPASSHTMVNNTFVDNHADSKDGQSLYVTDSDVLRFSNNIVYDSGLYESKANLYIADGNIEYLFDYNDVLVSSGKEFEALLFSIGAAIGEDGNIAVDPMFVSYAPGDVLSADFHLQTASACVDAGTREWGVDVDGSTPDQGAYGGPGGRW